MIGQGVSYGAVSVINAMPCGIGSTIGITLRTEAIFNPAGEDRSICIKKDPAENTEMARICVENTYKMMGRDEPEGWRLSISSQIPISRGLKSSSSACNAIISAVTDSERFDMPKIEMIRLGVNCARQANVTVTGAFDDACGCALGGLVVTDNRSDKILFHEDIGDYDVLIYSPKNKIKKTGLPLDELKRLAPMSEKLAEIARTDPFRAMTENGRMIASVSGIDSTVAEIALENGALGAGVSGSGPAIAIILEKGDAEDFAERSGLIGLIEARTRRIPE